MSIDLCINARICTSINLELHVSYKSLLQNIVSFIGLLCAKETYNSHTSHVYQDTCITIYAHMGWLRLVGSLKLYVSFAEYRLFYRALLRKRPIILRSLLTVATTPYCVHECHFAPCYFCFPLLLGSFSRLL